MKHINKFWAINAFLAWILLFTPSAQAQLGNASAGYKDGFFLQTQNGDFLLKMGSRLNFLYGYGSLEQQDNVASFDIQHAKLYMGGHAFNKRVSFYLQSEFAQHSRRTNFAMEHTNEAFALEDYYIQSKFGTLALQAGQYKVPFAKQWMIYSGNLQFIQRSLATNAFQFGRDRGVALFGQKSYFAYTMGVFNGASVMTIPNVLRRPTSQNQSNDLQNSGMMYVARLTVFPQRQAGYEESDIRHNEASRIEWGSTFAFDHNRDYDTDGDFDADEFGVETYSVGLDATYKRRGLSLQAEAFWREHDFENQAGITSMGAYAQAGYFLRPRSWEVAFRYSILEPNRDQSEDLSQEFSVVNSLYLSGNHRYKMMFQYSYFHHQTPVVDGQDHWLQWMLQFTI
jgi:phosphate-selective porin